MSIYPPSSTLPTFANLKAPPIPDDLDVLLVASKWFSAFSTAVTASNPKDIIALFVEKSFWRDLLALTWDFRTFEGLKKIEQFLEDRLSGVEVSALKLDEASVALVHPYPDISWISATFTFETKIGHGNGTFRLSPIEGGGFKAHTVFTNLIELKGHPEQIKRLRNPFQNHGHAWAEHRRKEVEFTDNDPTVLIVGAGHSGLEIAARLKVLGISALVVEKDPRVGDIWRNRYDALCTHDPVYYHHMPYMPFPESWPVFAPSIKLANWFESYVDALELNVWTSSLVSKARQDTKTNIWSVTVVRKDGSTRVVRSKHLVFAIGFGDCDPTIPTYPGASEFRGEILHSTAYKSPQNYIGKKAIVVGSGVSAHDVSADLYANGIDVTMYQRSSTLILSNKAFLQVFFKGIYDEDGPPTDVADIISSSFPLAFLADMGKRQTIDCETIDTELLNGLRKRGFKLNRGTGDAGVFLNAYSRRGGHYIDVGASQLISDGKIKLKNGGAIERFTPTGLKFKDGSDLEGDVIIFATGVQGDIRKAIGSICGEEVENKCKRIWGHDEELEIHGTWRDLGVPNLWYMCGGLGVSRFYSKHLALQIQAIEEGILDRKERYSLVGTPNGV
ncbi:hypothetical protein GYMLUDRAFT_45704 [Collybiopsis luxurians FD-317 M1]|uniref:FAD/NAD(P)-binding domain-containing protein n=1 Tax=Collybiopsis luxurians FD-317 M1 TaxID=944289 RepID=A0A0D0BRM6_9AGAR|nr:hypothetical protein GYMLUDRAFT_45704 [Collybiopsis luxurians FD-317 M1]